MSKTKKLESYAYIKCKPDDSAMKIAKAIRKAARKSERRYHEALYHSFIVALDLRGRVEVQADWLEIYRSDYWKDRRERDKPQPDASAEDKSKFVAIFLFAGPGEIRYDRAWKYGRVLHHCFTQGIDSEDLPELLEEKGGIERFLHEITAKDPRRSVNEAGSPAYKDAAGNGTESPIVAKASSTNDESEDAAIEDSDDVFGIEDGTGDAPEADDPPESKSEKIGIEASDEHLARAIHTPVGEKVQITAIREKGSGSWKHLRALDVKRLKK